MTVAEAGWGDKTTLKQTEQKQEQMRVKKS